MIKELSNVKFRRAIVSEDAIISGVGMLRD